MQVDKAAVQVLRGHHLLAALGDEQFQRIARATRLVELAPRQWLYRRGEAAGHVYLVLEGQIALLLHTRDGKEQVVELVRPGSSCAEALLFTEAPTYQMTASAATAATVAAVQREAFIEVLHESSTTCLRLLMSISRVAQSRLAMIEQLATTSALDRVVNHLLALAGADRGSVTVTLTEPKQLLASRLAIQPETLSRSLRALADAGMLSVTNSVIRIPDLARLREVPRTGNREEQVLCPDGQAI